MALRLVFGIVRWATLFLLISMLYVATSSAQTFNVTVDDQSGPSPRVGGVIEYSNGWTNMGFGLDGLERGAPAVAGFEDTNHGTWKKSVYIPGDPTPSATLKFRGTAVYVSCILNDFAQQFKANSDMHFTLDGVALTPFIRPALPTKPGIITTVFQQENLSPEEHTLKIQNGPSGGDSSAIFLDAIIYTTDNKTLGISSNDNIGSTTPSNNPPLQTETPVPTSSTSGAGKLNTHQIATIVGGVCGAVFGSVALLAFWVWGRRKYRLRFSIERVTATQGSLPDTSTFNPQPYPNSYTSAIPGESSPSSVAKAVVGPSRDGSAPRLDGVTTEGVVTQTSALHSGDDAGSDYYEIRRMTISSQSSDGAPPPSYHTRAS